MIKTSTELGIKVKNARLLTKAELEEYNEYMPNISFDDEDFVTADSDENF